MFKLRPFPSLEMQRRAKTAVLSRRAQPAEAQLDLRARIVHTSYTHHFQTVVQPYTLYTPATNPESFQKSSTRGIRDNLAAGAGRRGFPLSRPRSRQRSKQGFGLQVWKSMLCRDAAQSQNTGAESRGFAAVFWSHIKGCGAARRVQRLNQLSPAVTTHLWKGSVAQACLALHRH